MGFQCPVQFIQDKARLDPCRQGFGINVENTIQVPRIVQDDCAVHGLAALRCATTARKYGDFLFARDAHGGFDVLHGVWNDHGFGNHLVDRRVGGIPPERGGISRDLPDAARRQPTV